MFGRKVKRLEADLAEALATNASFVEANKAANLKIKDLNDALADLRSSSWALKVENHRLNNLLERAVFRDPDTGRLLPKGVH